MDKRLFERLVESVGQMNEIGRGERAPSREFVIDAVRVKEIRHATGLSQAKPDRRCHLRAAVGISNSSSVSARSSSGSRLTSSSGFVAAMAATRMRSSSPAGNSGT